MAGSASGYFRVLTPAALLAARGVGREVAEDGGGSAAALDGVVGGAGDLVEVVEGAGGVALVADLVAEAAEGPLNGDVVLDVGLGEPVEELGFGEAGVGGGDEEVGVGVEEGGEEVLVPGVEGRMAGGLKGCIRRGGVGGIGS